MKKYLILVSFVFSVVVAGAQIKFEKTDFATAMAKAKKENKILFLDASAVWCGPCKRMEKTVFADKAVGEYFSKNIVAFKIDIEKGEGPAIKNKYSIEGLPGYVFFDSNGNVIYRELGLCSIDKFMSYVKQAEAIANDPKNINSLIMQYKQNKNDEKFVRSYIEKMMESKAAGYFEEFEHYLSIQTTMPEQSKEMIDFLVANGNVLTYCGNADRIIDTNMKSDVWRQYVRKDVRDFFQSMPTVMGKNSSQYAIKMDNEDYMKKAIARACRDKQLVAGQYEAILMDFYYNAGHAEQYKKLAYDKISAFVSSLDVEFLKMTEVRTQAELRKNSKLVMHSHGKRNCETLIYFLKQYGKYVSTEQEKQQIIEWAKLADYIVPNNPLMANFYANVLYMFGDKKAGIELKEKSVSLDKDDKKIELYNEELKMMKAGQAINLSI